MNQINHPTAMVVPPTGTAKEVGWFKQAVRNIIERTLRVGPGLRASYYTTHTLVELEPSVLFGSLLKSSKAQLLILGSFGVNGQYWTTAKRGPDGSFSTIGPKVAIPHFYRSTFYNNGGATTGDTAGLGFKVVGSEIRKSLSAAAANDYMVVRIFPAYSHNQRIYALEVEGGTDAVDDAGEPVLWIDLTTRYLMVVPQDYSICRIENGTPTTRAALIDGGAVH